MNDEMKKLRAENERLRADLAIQQGCCDGAAAQDAHVRQEREEHRTEIERLHDHIDLLKEKIDAAKSCACSYDAPNEVCLPHSPLLAKARVENERLRDALRRIGAIETYSRRTWHLAVLAAREALEEN